VDEMVSDEFYEKCLFAIAHALDEVKTRVVVVVDYIKVWFLLVNERAIMHLNGEVILEATNVDHLWVLGH
jgi:hypothetical protein